MRKIEKLIKNKIYVNTYNKSKYRNYLFKKSIYNYLYLFLRFKKILKKPNKNIFILKNIFFCKNVIKKVEVKTQKSFIKLLIFLL